MSPTPPPSRRRADEHAIESVPIRDEMIRLGQLLKLAGVVEDGTEAKELLADDAVTVDGEPESRRGRQIAVGSVVTVDLPQGARSLRVVAGGT